MRKKPGNKKKKKFVQTEVEAYVETAMSFAREQDMELALEYIQKALSITPNDPQLLYLSGSAKYMVGDDEGCIEDLDKVIEINRKQPMAYVYRGAAKAALGEHWEGIKDLNKAVKLDPECSLAYAHRGRAYQFNKEGELFGEGVELTRAISDFDWAIKLKPEDPEYRYLRARAKVHSTGYKPEIILEDYDKAIELDSEFARGYFGRGTYKAELERFDEAIEDFDKCIELDPDYALAYSNRGMAKKLTHRFEEALEDFNKAVEIEPDNGLFYFHRGSLKGCLEDIPYEDQIADLDKALELSPDEPEIFYIRGIAKHDFGKYHEAIEDFERALDKREDHGNTYYYQGHCKNKQGGYSAEERLRDFDRAIELCCDKHRAYLERGFLRLEVQDYPGALKDAYRYIELEPEKLRGYELAVRVNYNVGNIEGVLRLLDKAFRIDPDYEWGLKVRQLIRNEEKKRPKYPVWDIPNS